MSMLPTCVRCDALLHGYNGDCVCKRCKEPCPTCGGDVAHCQHPLPAERAEFHASFVPMRFDRDPQTGNPRVAA